MITSTLILFVVTSRVCEKLISENDYDTFISILAEEVKESNRNVKCVS